MVQEISLHNNVKPHQQSSRKSARVYKTESYKMIKMYLKIQDIFSRPNESLPDMSGSQTEFCEDCISDQTVSSQRGLPESAASVSSDI